jgi:preprotein translocase subunit SecG
MWRIILTVVQVFSAFAIVGLVLLQRGKGAEAGAGFGAGASGTVFGARGASTALSRATAIFAAVFMINSLLLAYVGTKASQTQPQTILDQASETAPAAKTPAGAAKTPGQSTATAPAPAQTPSPAAPAQTPPPAAPAPTTSNPSPAPAAPESTPSPAPTPK